MSECIWLKITAIQNKGHLLDSFFVFLCSSKVTDFWIFSFVSFMITDFQTPITFSDLIFFAHDGYWKGCFFVSVLKLPSDSVNLRPLPVTFDQFSFAVATTAVKWLNYRPNVWMYTLKIAAKPNPGHLLDSFFEFLCSSKVTDFWTICSPFSLSFFSF